jgi:hypothetical protein
MFSNDFFKNAIDYKILLLKSVTEKIPLKVVGMLFSLIYSRTTYKYCSVLGTIVRALHILIHLVLNLDGWVLFSHCTEEETETQRDSSKLHKLHS